MTEKTHDEKYPEHAKLRAVSTESQRLGEFLSWLIDEADNGGFPSDIVDLDVEATLGRYFDVDPRALSREKDEMYRELVEANERQAEPSR